MTTEQEPFDFFDRGKITTGSQYLDTQSTEAPYDAEMTPQTIERAYVPSWDEPAYDEPMPAAEPISELIQREPSTPSWSYHENALFAAMPADVKARMENEDSPLFGSLSEQSTAGRLVQRVQEQTTTVPVVHRSVYHQLLAEKIEATELIAQDFRATEAAFDTTTEPGVVPESQPQPEPIVHAADLPISTAAYHEPVPLWGAPRRAHDGNVGLERDFRRGPLPDTLTPRLEVPTPAIAPQEALAPVATKIFADAETPPAQVEAASGLSKDGSEAFLGRIARLAEQQESQDGEVTQVISTADLAKTVAEEQKISAGDELAAHVAVEEVVAALETKPPKIVRTYGQMLLDAAKFKFRVARDKTSGAFVGEIVDSEGTVHVDKINLDEHAEGERMRTTRRLIGRMARLRMKIPKLPDPRIV